MHVLRNPEHPVVASGCAAETTLSRLTGCSGRTFYRWLSSAPEDTDRDSSCTSTARASVTAWRTVPSVASGTETVPTASEVALSKLSR